MAAPTQIAANRANAARSTGPRTEAGKARSSYNSLRHGLYAQEVVLPGEDRAEFDTVVADLMAELRPHGRYEARLARAFETASMLLERRQKWRRRKAAKGAGE